MSFTDWHIYMASLAFCGTASLGAGLVSQAVGASHVIGVDVRFHGKFQCELEARSEQREIAVPRSQEQDRGERLPVLLLQAIR